MPLEKILISNRGEIAVRIIRACRELGIGAVAVYSDADANAMHVRLADEAVHIGGSPPRDSYLNIERIVQAALSSGAQAVHPGYGFLSENAAFARAVAKAGLIFIGPPPAAIEAMGNKTRARALMQTAGVPVVPGLDETATLDERTLAKSAAAMGYPLLVKAAAGGGGKGMRIVREAGELIEALASARREAAHAFGDDSVFIEKYIENPRHIEFQILADSHGGVLHLFERECSIQRRHQKIIEETPSPFLTAALRDRMGRAAVAAAKAVGYTNAGTVEFIADDRGEFYFLEMNTRLQVEHPVTEMVTGLDLVQAQIRIAQGESLWFSQGEVNQRGHAIECRVYAEDPTENFLPSVGKLLALTVPAGPGLRIDSGVEAGDEVTRHYDPMIAKVIAHAETRAAATAKLSAALGHMTALGVTTNIPFLLAALQHPAFASGDTTTHFIERHLSNWQLPPAPPELFIAAALADSAGAVVNGPTTAASFVTPWDKIDSFRIGMG